MDKEEVQLGLKTTSLFITILSPFSSCSHVGVTLNIESEYRSASWEINYEKKCNSIYSAILPSIMSLTSGDKIRQKRYDGYVNVWHLQFDT